MKSKTIGSTALIILFLATAVALAGKGGPDSDGYRWIDSNEPGGPPYSWVEISPRAGGSGTVISQGDDKNSGLVPILPRGGFRYRGTVYTTLAVCSNGWLSFSDGVDSSYSGSIPDTMPPNNTLAPFWTDLYPVGGSYGNVYYFQDTLGGRNRTIVEWDSVAEFNSGTFYKFEVVLDSVNTVTFFQYKYSDNWTGSTASIGIENFNGMVGLSVGQSNLGNGYAIKFYTDIPHDVGMARIVRPNSVEIPMNLLVPNAWIKNFGTTADTFPVFCMIDSAGTQIYLSQRQVTGLVPGDTLLVKFDPWTVGPDNNSYNVSFYTALSGDPDPSNDTLKVAVLSSQGQRGWLPAVNMGDSINTAYEDWCDSFSGDGNQFYLHSDRPGGQGGFDIWVSNRVNTVWQKPINIGSPINSSYDEGDAWISADGNFMVFSSDRPGGFGDYDLWTSNKVSGVWQTPVNMGATINSSSGENAPWLSADTLRMYFSSNRDGGYGNWDIYMSEKSGGQWQSPTNLGPVINYYWLDTGPCLTADEMTLYYNQGGDLFTSQNISGQWQPHVSLGPNINSSSREDRPRLSSSGTTLYFMSDRPGGYGSWDVYKSEWGILGTEEHGSSPFPGKTSVLVGFPKPNPSSHLVSVSLGLPIQTHVEASIYNVAGQRVKILVQDLLPTGNHEITWDERDAKGIRVAAGLYYFRVHAGNKTVTRQTVILK